MKFIDLLNEDQNIQFDKKIDIVVVNSDGNNINIKCEVPSNREEERQGLMYRENLCDNCGLFYGNHSNGFWMKNVSIPLDMIFIMDDTVVSIVSAKPFDEKIINPNVDFNGNIEVNSDFCKNNNINIGDKIYKL